MKKFFIIIGLIILVVVGGGVTLMLMSFNPAAYQKQVIASVKELTGRDLFVGGTTSVTWSPMPTIVMKNVRLSNISQSREDVMLTAESVRAPFRREAAPPAGFVRTGSVPARYHTPSDTGTSLPP